MSTFLGQVHALTELYGDPANPTWGLVYGGGVENYQLSDGRFLPMKTRWTATVVKEADGKWRILALHIGANFYDNPIFAAVKDSTKHYAAGGLVAGLLLGGLGMLLLHRKKSFIVNPKIQKIIRASFKKYLTHKTK